MYEYDIVIVALIEMMRKRLELDREVALSNRDIDVMGGIFIIESFLDRCIDELSLDNINEDDEF